MLALCLDSSESSEEEKKPAARSSVPKQSNKGVKPNKSNVDKEKVMKLSYVAKTDCLIAGCKNPHEIKGYCRVHARDPNAPVPRDGKTKLTSSDFKQRSDNEYGLGADGAVKDPKDWAIRLSHTKSGMGLNKNIVHWQFVHQGEKHDVELLHSTFGGKRTIKVDGVTKVSEKKLIDNGSKYHLEAGSSSATHVLVSVELKPVGVSGVTYELYIDGRDYDHAKRHWLYSSD
jgi:hypothetical protein